MKKTKLKDYNRFDAIPDEMAHVRRAPTYSAMVGKETPKKKGNNGRKGK